MADINFSWSDGGLKNMIEDLQAKEIRRIERKSLGKAAGVIKRAVKNTFKKELPAATQSSEKYNDRLIDAIRSTVYEENNEMMMKVHGMGSGKTGSGTFRARFFAVGTRERNSDGHNRGSIKATNFFNNGVSASSGKALSTINTTFSQELQKVLEKKYNDDKI